jgi:hypothetical protein
MRTVPILAAALALGLGAGYAWSALFAPAAQASTHHRKATIALPASPEEQPEALDGEWAARAADQPAPPPAARATAASAADSSVYYAGCYEVRAAGKAPLHSGDPGYRIGMDGDGDGVACEPYTAGP